MKTNQPTENDPVFGYKIIESLPETTEVLLAAAVILTFGRGELPWTLGVPAWSGWIWQECKVLTTLLFTSSFKVVFAAGNLTEGKAPPPPPNQRAGLLSLPIKTVNSSSSMFFSCNTIHWACRQLWWVCCITLAPGAHGKPMQMGMKIRLLLLLWVIKLSLIQRHGFF